jgi:hypothetical protein
LTPEDTLLCALAAAVAPRHAADWLRRAPTPGSAEAAARLAPLPRAVRLAAVSAAAPPPCRSPAAPTRERLRVAAVLAALASGRDPAPGVSPVLLRLCRERLAADR